MIALQNQLINHIGTLYLKVLLFARVVEPEHRIAEDHTQVLHSEILLC